MARTGVERRLAAILSADVVGYGRLIGADESGTLAMLREHRRELIDPAVEEFGGRIVKLMGDGILAEFGSAVGAVECALAIQHGMAVRNASTPSTRRIVFRIGVNLGDVAIEDGDIYGDGVNVAARLQSVAEPGGLYISGIVHEQVDGKIDESFVDMGSQQFKNIAKPVRVFRANILDADADEKQRPFFSRASAASVTGGCLCGNVRFEITGQPADVAFCHCRMCQRWTGGSTIAGASFPETAFQITKGEPKYYRSSPVGRRGFCPDCGSGLVFRRIDSGDETEFVFVYVASLDHPENYAPTWHLGIESQMPWLRLSDDLPRVRCKDTPYIVEAWASAGMDVPEPNLR